MPNPAVARKVDETRRELLALIAREAPLIVVKAPPGSGKTFLVRQATALLRRLGKRVAIAAQTNSQADDICIKLGEEFPNLAVVRFVGTGALQNDLGSKTTFAEKFKDLPTGPCVVVGTTAKWGLINITDPFDYLLVDEAWQMAWSDFMLTSGVAPRFAMVGDPGQIDPVVAIDVSRWATSKVPPHAPTPELLLANRSELPLEELALPASRRLPHDSVEVVRAFYDFSFEAWAEPGARAFKPRRGGGEAPDPALDMLASGSMTALTLPTPLEGPPLEDDRQIAALAAATATRMLDRGAQIEIDGETERLAPTHIGITATHRVINSRIREYLPAALRPEIVVDTPERWQGLERPMMIAVHPISGAQRPSVFDLETGRLCVMASRHQVGLVVVTRDHVAATLEEIAPSAEQAVGLPDSLGLGHDRHVEFWKRLERAGRVVAVA